MVNHENNSIEENDQINDNNEEIYPISQYTSKHNSKNKSEFNNYQTIDNNLNYNKINLNI